MLATQWRKFLLLAVYLAGCTKIPKYSEEQVAVIINSRLQKEVHWNQNYCKDPQIQAYIQTLASQALTSEAAVQIALLNNPQIQATFETLGVAQADLVEAGLLTNPVFEVEVRYPHAKKLSTNIEYLITAIFLDIFLLPLRTKLAAIELEQAKLRVSNEILNLAFEVRQTYYEFITQLQKLQYTQAIVQLTSIHHEIVSRQNKVGNINFLDFQQIQARFLEAKLELAKSQSEIIRLREKLNRLLGFDKEVCLSFPNELPEETDYQGFDIGTLELLALKKRLDLQVARFEVARISRMLGLKDWWVYTNLRTGLAGERDPDGTNLVGYGIAGEVPIFNYGQAARMRLFAQFRQARNHLTALEIRTLSEVREAHRLLMNDLEIINNYKNQILPIQNKILNSSEELYNVMGLGIDRLLENKRQELEAYRNYLESLKDYQVARIQLDKALGGYLFLLLTPDSCVERVAE